MLFCKFRQNWPACLVNTASFKVQPTQFKGKMTNNILEYNRIHVELSLQQKALANLTYKLCIRNLRLKMEIKRKKKRNKRST